MSSDKPTVSRLGDLPRQQVIVTFIGVLFAVFLGALDQTIVATAMPDIVTDLGGFSHYTFITTAYLITSTVFIPVTGRLVDVFGRKWFYTAGIAIFVLGSLLSGLSHTLTELIIYRAFQGIGAGIMIANAFVVIGDLFPPAQRGRYQSYISVIFGLASVIGPLLGGYITDTISWNWIFFINVPLGIIVIILFVFYFPSLRPAAATERVDYPGIVLLMLTTVPLMLALSWAEVEYPWFSPEIIGMLVFSLIMALAFYIVERRNPEPVLPLRFFTDRTVSVSMAVSLFTGFAMFGAIIFIPLYFQGVLGLSATSSGSFLTPMMLGVVAGSLTAGQLLSRGGGHYKVLGIVGLAVMSVGMALLFTLTTNTSYAIAVLYIVVAGLGLGVTFPLYPVIVQNVVPYKSMGVVVSSIPFNRFLGGAFGLAILGSILTTRFAADFLNRIPEAVKQVVPPDRLSALAHNPQALISLQAQNDLKAALAPLGSEAGPLFNQILQSLRQSLTSALTEIFIISFAMTVVAFLIHLLIKEIPLRRQHD
jgi:EmrB/QacA subfamily drug resistance transporter